MILDEILRRKLSEGAPGSERHEVLATDPDTGWTVHLTLDKRDALSCLFWEMRMQRNSPVAPDLRFWAEAVATNTKGLLEPLAVLEVDEQRNQALIRSESPSRRGDVQAYFEVLLDGTKSATVRRYQVATTGSHKREQVAFALTHESLFKLVDGLMGR
jgi:hypothetical protein